jgi:hypothetical protein
MYLIRLDETGKKMSQFNLSKVAGDKNITSISGTRTKSGSYVYTGTYSNSSSYSAQGLFFAESVDGSMKYIHFYNFLDLDDFLSYLPEKKQKKIEKKQKKKESHGKELSYSFNIADHDIIEKEDGYIFVGESYYPTYRTETYTTYTTDANGVSHAVTRTRQVFDGYQYTHAVVAKFDKEGKMVWDKTFSLWASYKPFYVKRFIQIAENDNKSLNLVYATGGYISSKSFNPNTGVVLKSETTDRIETVFKGDEVKRSFTNIDYWYGKYFLAHGTQKIKNKENDKVNRKRKVFFFSKVKY